MKKFTITLLFILVASLAFAQEKDDGQELITRFFDLYKGKGYDYALKYAFETNKWIPSQGDEMLAISVKLGKAVVPLGEYLGNEEIKSKTISSRYRIASYFVYYQREPIRFTFELYKNGTGWEIWDFQFDSDFDTEIIDAMKFGTESRFR